MKDRRKQSEKVKKFHLSDNLEIPNWKDLMKNPNDKANLLNHIAASVSKYPEILPRSIKWNDGRCWSDDNSQEWCY